MYNNMYDNLKKDNIEDPNSFEKHLKNLLKNYIDNEGKELLKRKIINLALSYDKELISILIKDEQCKSRFFLEIKEKENNTTIFKLDDFVFFLEDKSFLSNSYTKYRNKIGLSFYKDKLLTKHNEVVLNYPFKDTILEGGQSKDDDKRREIFFNEVLARDEIDRLFDPKALVNFKKYTSKGEEEFKEFNRYVFNKENGEEDKTIKDNLVIKGNNLLALHSIKEEFRNKIKLIYIDPPYNTGNDTFNYNDNFNHSTWLVFMKDRLKVARELLKDDGVIFVQIDDNEQAYLKVMMDEIFGRENFINNFLWMIGKGKKDKHSRTLEQYILCYCKDKSVLNEWKIMNKVSGKFMNPDNDKKGIWMSGSISFSEERSNKKHKNYFKIKSPSGIEWERQWPMQ